MQCKTFCGTDINRIEEDINEFLAEEEYSSIEFIKQSEGESDYGHLYTFSIWYEREKKATRKKRTTTKKKTASKKKRAKKKT